MQNSPGTSTGDEIDLGELFSTLWAHKFFIACICATGILLSGYYALSADKKFTAEAVFKLDNNPSSGIALTSEMSAVASLAGLNMASNETEIPFDEVMGREFIEYLDQLVNLRKDSYFNTYTPNTVDPAWKTLIKNLVGWQKSPTNVQEIIWQGIATKYSDNVVIDATDDGALKVMVTHDNAHRAAKIANTIMTSIIIRKKNKQDLRQDQQLAYLAQTMANSLNDLENAQTNLKNFALENSALPLENFAAVSMQLDNLREQLIRTEEFYNALVEITNLLKLESTSDKDYLLLQQKNPVVDQVDFRRLLGQNEIINSWNWPDLTYVNAISNTMYDRMARLKSSINVKQLEAKRSGIALEKYAKLERESEIAEATYTVLIEQVKAQSMMAGYRPDNSEIYEYASPPLIPSKPKRNLILIIGALLGLFTGCAIALSSALIRGVFYSKRSLFAGAEAHFNLNVRPLMSLRKKQLKEINKRLNKRSRMILRDLAMEIYKSGADQITVTSSKSKLKGIDIAKVLSTYMQSETETIAIINFSEKNNKKISEQKTTLSESFIICEEQDQISVLHPNNNLGAIELLGQRDFKIKLELLNKNFDIVFLCADNAEAISLASALANEKTVHITVARLKRSKWKTLAHMRTLLPIQGLLHE